MQSFPSRWVDRVVFRLRRGVVLAKLAVAVIVMMGYLGMAPAGWALDGAPPYSVAPPTAFPQPGTGLPRPSQVPGKEFSHNGDLSVAGVALQGSLGQVVAWDGQGGVADSITLRPLGPNGVAWYEIDALANHADTLFDAILEDTSHLLFSVSQQATGLAGEGAQNIVPSAGPMTTTSGLVLGGAAEISYELGTISPSAARFGVWATQSQLLLGANVTDIDALELWGPDSMNVPPGGTAMGDSDKFSIAGDASVAPNGAGPFAIWNTGSRPSAPGYLLHSDLVDAIEGLMGWDDQYRPDPALVDIDALMIHDQAGTNPDQFDTGDRVLLSLRQIPDDNGGFFATGSEFILLQRTAQGFEASFLMHNGHLWDKQYALDNLVVDFGTSGLFLLDINALEAASVPEPASLFLVVALVLLLLCRSKFGRLAT